jgi:hypothetical protein
VTTEYRYKSTDSPVTPLLNVMFSQSKELTRGSPELVQHFRLKGEFTSEESAWCPKFDMVWLNLSPIPRSNDFYCLRYT